MLTAAPSSAGLPASILAVGQIGARLKTTGQRMAGRSHVAVGEFAARVARLHAGPIIPSAFLVCPMHRVVRAGRFEQDRFILLVANKLKDDAEIVAGGARPRTRRLALGLWARRGG